MPRSISFKKRYVAPIRNGKKTFTLRTSTTLKAGDNVAALCKWGDPPFARLLIKRVESLRLGELTDADARAAGHDDLDAYRRSWNTLYPNQPWRRDRRIHRIHFRVDGRRRR